MPDGVNWLDLRSVLVAWKDTPEARRALADALPILRKARDVTVVEFPKATTTARRVAGRDRRDAWLARHGVTAIARVPKGRNETVAGQLEKIAGDVGASLIVAGAYGHSRFRELILGGVTQYLVTQSARCVLLSH